MKCKFCDGTGTSNTCVNGTFKPCSFCDGTGEYDPNEVDRFNAVDAIKVMEMVKKEQTNEEWFCQLPTEEKADFFANIYPKSVGEALIKISNGDKEKWEEWLKEKHNG